MFPLRRLINSEMPLKKAHRLLTLKWQKIPAYWYRWGSSQIPKSICSSRWSGHGDSWFAKWHRVESQIKGQWLLGTCQQRDVSSQYMFSKSEHLLWINLPLCKWHFHRWKSSNQSTGVGLQTDNSQTASDWLSVLMSLTIRQSHTMLSHSHHIYLSWDSIVMDKIKL